MRDMVNFRGCSGGGRDDTEFATDSGLRQCWCDCATGARMSESVPVAKRARVEVMATMDTWVAGEVLVATLAGVSVSIMVPRLLMKASPGPVTRKKPAASHHMVGSIMKRRVSSFRSHVFLRASSSAFAFRRSASDCRKSKVESDRSCVSMVP